MSKDFYIVYTADKEYLFGADTFTECVAYCQDNDINGANGEYIAEGTLDTEYNDFEMSDCYDIPVKNEEENEMKKYTVENDTRRGDIDVDVIRAEYEDMTWRAAELVTDRGVWEVR